jgi:hypothetical protein
MTALRYLSTSLAQAFALVMLVHAATVPSADRWSLEPAGGISWLPKFGDPHSDHVEMAGKQLAAVVTYRVDEQKHLQLSRDVVWPMLRFEPQDTFSHLNMSFGSDAEPRLFVNRLEVPYLQVNRIVLDGLLRVEGNCDGEVTYNRTIGSHITITRTIFPSTSQPELIERNVVTNRSDKTITFEVESNDRQILTNPARGTYGGYVISTHVDGVGEVKLAPNQSTEFALEFTARRVDAPEPKIDPTAEEGYRRERIARILSEMRLETPEPELNTEFAFSKIRTTESIFATKAGLLHSPGGGAYYAAIWANDQAEYVGPFFGMLADPGAREAGLNTYRLFARYMNPDFRPIPSSIIAEGTASWNAKGDRGDMAMIAYGAARYALARGDHETAEELWPLVDWCLEYCRRRLTADGVVASDSDELENRFPSGHANLSTSCLYYDALNSAAYLAKELGRPDGKVQAYQTQGAALHGAIEKYFGATVEGFATYRYFDRSYPGPEQFQAHYSNEPDHLRAWICLPLVVGIVDRAPGTIDALFSPNLWTKDGLATEAGLETFWDRSTLYALRGVFSAGETARALEHLRYYTNRRLLGDHVPYPVEAYPEGNQQHLAAEAALYCRIYTEGLFGLRPTGLNSFTLTPRLPDGWSTMALRGVHAFGSNFDIEVGRADRQLKIEIKCVNAVPKVYRIAPGDQVSVKI